MTRSAPVFIGLFALLTASVAEAQTDYNFWDKNYTVQALLGAARFDNLKFNIQDSATPTHTDLSTLPQLGGAWTTLPKGKRFQYGLESSLLLGFQVDKVNYLYLGGGGLHVSLSTSLWTFDLAGGGYLSLFLDPARKVRLYAGGGPLLMYVDYHADKEFSDNSNSESSTKTEFGVGAYARTGIEYRLYEKGMLGIGARSSWVDINLSDIGGRSRLRSVGFFATFTAGF